LKGPQFKDLVADIAAHGLREPIVMFGGKILDGRNRYRACLRAGVRPRFEEFKGDDNDARAFVFSKNICRRHLKAKEKKAAVDALITAMPEKSDRELGRMIKTDHKVISRARKRLESTGAAPQLPKRVGADGKARKQPAARPAPAPAQIAVEHPISPVTTSAAASEVVVEKIGPKGSAVAVTPEEAVPAKQEIKPLVAGEGWNPIAKAWAKATEKQRAEFALQFHVNIMALVAAQRRTDPVQAVQESAVAVTPETTSTVSPTQRKRVKALTAEDLKRNEADGQMRLPLASQPSPVPTTPATSEQTAASAPIEPTVAAEQTAALAAPEQPTTSVVTTASTRKTRKPVIIADEQYPTMFRVQKPDGTRTDMMNRGRAEQMLVELEGRAS
jgi:ParB-like chromosome segregation protein Spo0J